LIQIACFGILILGRIVNWALPLSLRALIESLEYGTGKPWFYLTSYVVLRYLQSSGGLGAIRDLLWTPVMQYSDRAMSQLSFDHLLNLSLAFHTHRKTGEILRILDRGAAINRIFELLLFNLVPIVLDIVIALVMFVIYFEWTLAFVIGLDMAAYMAASVLLTRWRTKLRRQMNDRDVITRGIHTDCLLNYETVKYFNGERHEAARYADAIGQYQALEFRVISKLPLPIV
jgi:ABC-type transport system involved in Fe-S cluster assembly fused permease/ATPase subunit